MFLYMKLKFGQTFIVSVMKNIKICIVNARVSKDCIKKLLLKTL